MTKNVNVIEPVHKKRIGVFARMSERASEWVSERVNELGCVLTLKATHRRLLFVNFNLGLGLGLESGLG